MINFRYHIVSLVAIFLALGVGALFGGSFIQEGTVKLLQAAQGRLDKDNTELRDVVRATQRQVASLTGFASAAKGSMVGGALAGRPVVIVTLRNSPDAAVNDVITTLQQAGGRVDAALRLSANVDGSTETRLRQIALALGSSSSSDEELKTAFAGRLADALAGRTRGFLQRLVDVDLADAIPVTGNARALADVPSAGSAVVIIAGKPDGNSTVEQGFALPLVRALAAIPQTVVAVCEPESEEMELAPPLRDDPATKAMTVDGVSSPVGQTALVLGLQAAFGGKPGHYGSGKGASSLLPPRS